jgi:predicted DNA binding CopG/RHH family protein
MKTTVDKQTLDSEFEQQKRQFMANVDQNEHSNIQNPVLSDLTCPLVTD